jgi:hypothetical protein
MATCQARCFLLAARKAGCGNLVPDDGCLILTAIC